MRNIAPGTSGLYEFHAHGILPGELGREMIVGYSFRITHLTSILADFSGRIADGLVPLPHHEAWQIANGFAHGHRRQQAALVRIGEPEREHSAAAPEIRAPGGVVGGLRRHNLAESGAKENQPPALLRNAVMRSKENFHGDVIVEAGEFREDAVKHFAVAQGQEARDVFKKKRLGLELFEEPHIILEKLVAWIGEETLRRIDGETLARRPASKDIEFPSAQAQLCPDLRGFYILNVAAVGPGPGVVISECLNRLGHAVVRIEAIISRLPESFRDSPCPGKQ